jgi:hypothetical protein
MIVGAHIAQAGSDSSQHCPSVAAVVANIDRDLAVYPGSVRLQPSTCKVNEKNARHAYCSETTILELEAMMRERCAAWVNEHLDIDPQIVFYRAGLNILNNGLINLSVCEIIEKETNAIQSAVLSIRPGRGPRITYVLVNNRAESASPCGPHIVDHLAGKGIYTFDRPPPASGKHGEQYSIIRDLEGSTETAVDVEKLVSLVDVPI